jgi:hypothetical protein
MLFISESSFQKSGSRRSKEDSVQIPSQKSQIQRFRPDGPIMRPDAHQYLEDSNSLRLHPSRRNGNTSRRSSEFDKKSDFLHKHRDGKIATFVRMTGQYCLDAILSKARHEE